ncbi:MAG TPA: hypothetical protein VK149_06525 [Sideroxyarcus sp.]|nr:hypothetical protein [Sideroxyarcus sp.]
MNRYAAILFFIKVILGMSASLVVFAELDIRWWQDEGVIIPALLLVDAILSFYFVYRLAKAFHFPLGAYSVVPVMYGMLVPLVALAASLVMDMPSIAAILNSISRGEGGIIFPDQAIIILSIASGISLTITCVVSWLFMKIKDEQKRNVPE